MRRAVKMVEDVVTNDKDMLVVVDADTDGFMSSALLINYLYSRYPDYTTGHVNFIMHDGKMHGLADICDEILRRRPALLVSPDGGTNDKEQQNVLNDAGTDVLVLDHHPAQADYTNDHTLVINVQLSDYPNKALTGGGVVFKFLQAYEDIVLHGPQPMELIDLAMVANVGDMADYREPETRALVNIGSSNMTNPFLMEMCDRHKYVLEKRGGINYLSLAFGVVPFINAMTRSGTPQEQSDVFCGLLSQHSAQGVKSSKRGFGGALVPLYSEAVTLADRVKRRQDKIVNETFEHFQDRIEKEHLTRNAIIVLLCDPDEVEANHAGLLANKVQAKYQHPTLVLRKYWNSARKEYVYQGSGRNYSHCEIEDMRGVCAETNLTLFAQGHPSAYGIAIPEANIEEFVEKTNKAYAGIDFTPTYLVDYEWEPSALDPHVVLDIANLDIWGQQMPQAKVAVRDIALTQSNVQLLGLAKGNPTIKIQVGEIECMLFHASKELYERFTRLGNQTLTVVGTCSVNTWNGVAKPQILVDDYELQEKWVF